ncbi:MAG: ABC transporter ATP-binding protein [Nocardioidaceae bacterium]
MSAVVEVRQLTKVYGGRRGHEVKAVDSINMTVDRGEVYGFLGPNGAGKTTTIRMVLGLVNATAGQVRVLGRRPGSREALEETGSLIEGPAFYPYLSGQNNLRVVARYAGLSERQIPAALDLVDLAERSRDRYSTYSLGMKQRLGVAAALLKDPRLIVLDEPTNGLDPAGMRDMRAIIGRLGAEGRTVLLSSHLMGEVQQVCDRVAVIDHGRILVETTVAELTDFGELVVAATPSDLARTTLLGMAEVESVQARDGRLHVRIDSQHTAEVARRLVEAGVALSELRRDERQLEDAFFEMTDKKQEPSHA